LVHSVAKTHKTQASQEDSIMLLVPTFLLLLLLLLLPTCSLQDCWSGDPLSRPSMDAVVSRLEAAAASGDLQGMDKPAGCACTIC
jgi:hypothetical protein